jgi:hypothetical protein
VPGQKWQPSNLEVVRIQFFGKDCKDLDVILRKKGLSLTMIPQVVLIGSYQFDLLVTESGARLLKAVPLPIALKNHENEATEIFRGERLTKQDPLVRYWGGNEAIKRTTKAYEREQDNSWEQTKPFLTQLIQRLQELPV